MVSILRTPVSWNTGSLRKIQELQKYFKQLLPGKKLVQLTVKNVLVKEGTGESEKVGVLAF